MRRSRVRTERSRSGRRGTSIRSIRTDRHEQSCRLPGSSSGRPGRPDGKSIAFTDWGLHLYVADPDGSNARVAYKIADGALFDPAWSPDGTQLAVTTTECGGGDCTSGIAIANADGSGGAGIPGALGIEPDWSPDGTKIAYDSGGCDLCTHEIYTIHPDGTQKTRITFDANGGIQNGSPSWSPDATKIAFSHSGGADGLYEMNPDGTGRALLSSGAVGGPRWSPDGKQFALVRQDCSSSPCVTDIYVMNRDGSGQLRLTNDHKLNRDPDWQPVPQTYPRPKGATPFKTFLVVAYKPCTAPDRTHGAPLSYGSCSSPQPASDFLTVGTGDSNGQAPNSIDSVRYDVLVGNPRTPADEADVAAQIAMRDIRNRSDLSDYTGELQVTSNMRITDRDNTPSPGGPGPATVQDTPLSATVPCTATADTGIGATCNLTTSEEAITPGAVKEGRRAVWALGQVQAYDGGPDGLVSTQAGNTLFLDEGVFVP